MVCGVRENGGVSDEEEELGPWTGLDCGFFRFGMVMEEDMLG